MADTDIPTISELIEEAKDNLNIEGLDTTPNRSTILRRLNRAKNDVAAQVRLVDPLHFLMRADYTVTADQTYITLPDGTSSGTPYPDDANRPAWAKVLGLYKVEDDYKSSVNIYDERDQGLRESSAGFWMYREGWNLYFHALTGAPEAMTLRLQYAARQVDLDGNDATATYALIPADWSEMIAIGATLMLLPASMPAQGKWQMRWNRRLAELTRDRARPIHTGPAVVKMTEDPYG